MDTIPCTVGILTRNSGSTLRRALESAQEFDDIIVCDGGSTDGTQDIARSFGARVVEQRSEYTEDGKICDYAGVRNQTLELAQHPWFLFLDSDEYLTPELVDEIRGIITKGPAAYWVPRYYTWGGARVVCSTTYPNRQMRLFNRSVATRFIRPVHERIELASGARVGELHEYMVVPLDTTREELWRKWDRYIALGDQSTISFTTFIRGALRHVRPSILFLLRHVRMAILCRGHKLPLWRELAEHTYNAKVIYTLWTRYIS